jgi:hypothetical protein
MNQNDIHVHIDVIYLSIIVGHRWCGGFHLNAFLLINIGGLISPLIACLLKLHVVTLELVASSGIC